MADPRTPRRRASRQGSKAETVPASEIAVGDLVFFPNSRQAAEVEQVVERDGIIGLIAHERTVSWSMPADADVRREKKGEEQ